MSRAVYPSCTPPVVAASWRTAPSSLNTLSFSSELDARFCALPSYPEVA
ncbi:hypothetical protein AB0P21_00435 [Kribbella sp. NPDC056861]